MTDTTNRPKDQPKLLAGQVSFTPATIQVSSNVLRQQIQVAISDIKAAGTWSGQVMVRWTGTTTGEMNIPITVTFKTVPTLVLESPTSVVVRTKRDSGQISRTVTLRETGKGLSVTSLSVLTRDLLNDDQSAVFPKSAITTG
jgi:hypothetical protein